MTITREQVERIAGWLEERPVVRMIGAGGIVLDDEQIASMLRDLWQRVEAAEALISWIAEQDYRGNRSIEQGKCIAYLRDRQKLT